MDSSCAISTIVDLGLDPDPSPRRLVRLGAHWLAYGGDDGTLVLLETTAVQVARTYDDDGIRAVAVSHDQLRVVVGFASGKTDIYAYTAASLTAGAYHPFLQQLNSNETNDETEISYSQLVSSNDTTHADETVFAGPQFDTAVRDLVFVREYHVAMACERSLVVVNASSSETVTTSAQLPLKAAAELAYDKTGVRGLSLNRTNHIVSSLGLNGRVCHWDCSDVDPTQWKLLHREESRAVLKADVGEVFTTCDVYDRSLRPTWVSDTLVAIGGQTQLQLRSLRHDGTFQIQDQPASDKDNENGIKGHLETIVKIEALGSSEYLASCGRDGRVIVWHVKEDPKEKGRLKASFERKLGEYDSAPVDLVWDKDAAGNERLLIVCADGKLITISGRSNFAHTVTSSKSKETKSTTSKKSKMADTLVAKKPGNQDIDTYNVLKTASVNKTTVVDKAEDDDDEDDSVENAGSNVDDNRSPSKTSKKSRIEEMSSHDSEDDTVSKSAQKASIKKNPFVMDEAEDGEEDEDSVGNAGFDGDSTQSPVVKSNEKLERVNSFASDDDGGDHPTNHSIGDGNDQDDQSDDGLDDVSHRGQMTMYQPSIKLPEPQIAFVPSATPTDLARRFMCWNHMGAITHLQGEAGVTRSSIDIHFTDSAFRRPISFTDNMGFILGCLGEEGGIFATDVEEDEEDEDLNQIVKGLKMSEATKAALKKSHKSRMNNDSAKPTGSNIYFHRFETFANVRDKDWYLTLPDGERAIGCATGEGWAAVMTSRRFLRIFSTGGNQGHVLWLPGEPVTMVGRQRFLAAFYHEAQPLPDSTQKLGYILFDAHANRVIARGSVSCISSGCSLTWAGFSNDGSLLAMDSDGMLSMLATAGPPDDGSLNMTWEWMPMLDTVGHRKSNEDSFWPVYVYEGKLVCVPLKGGVKHPDASRRPVTTNIGFRLPFARGGIAKNNAFEELSIRANVALCQKKAVHSIAGDDDDKFDKEYLALSAQVDKVTLKMFHAVVEAGKLERALDLVGRLHLEVSYNLAAQIADSHRKLVDRIEELKANKFEDDKGSESDEEDPHAHSSHDNNDLQHVSPDSSHAPNKRNFGADGVDANLGFTRRVRAKNAFP